MLALSFIQAYIRKQKFKAKLKNRFKNCRRSVENPVIDQEREVRGIQRKKRPEGMAGMCPPYKKLKSQAAQEVARYSHMFRHAADESAKKSVLRESFALRRHLLTRHRGRKTPSQMQEMFPEIFTESAVSFCVNGNKTILIPFSLRSVPTVLQ